LLTIIGSIFWPNWPKKGLTFSIGDKVHPWGQT
jgi:hypothetical protein